MHECLARGCELIIPRSQLMCKHHWRKVPLDLRRAVNEAWREFQKTTSPETYRAYMDVRQQAINSVPAEEQHA